MSDVSDEVAARRAKAEIINKFGPKSNDPAILDKCLQIMKLFQFSVDDLFVKWESYVMTTSVDNDLPLTLENLEKLHQRTQTLLTKQNTKSPLNTLKVTQKPVMRATFGSPGNNGLMNMSVLSTPVSSAKKRKLETPKSGSSANGSRVLADTSNLAYSPSDSPSMKKSVNNSGKVLESLNADIPLDSSLVLSSKITIGANFNASKYKFRTMNQKLLEASDVLDEQIDTVAKIILDHYKLDQNEFGNPCLASPTELIAVGRIVPDSPLTAYDAELNSSSLFLETSRLGGIGQRVSLELSKLTNYSFFPGQIVALKGRNPSGEFFQVTELLEIPYLGAPVTTEEDINTFYGANTEDIKDKQLKIVSTCGPYTSNGDLDYTQLKLFVEKMNNEVHPQLIIMLGPFIDITHPKIKDGTLEFPDLDPSQYPKTVDELFKTIVSPILKKLQNCQVILIPSTKDASSKHAAYPQDSLDRKSLELPKNFKCFPNPSSFQLNEFLVGVSNTDIFKDLKDVNRGNQATTSRFDRIADHVLQQRRYYPLFPGSIKTKSNSASRGLKDVTTATSANENDDGNNPEHISGVDLHVPYLGLTELGDVIPDILIMPSELKQFARVAKNVVVINPGYFMKTNSNGSYGVLTISTPDIEKLTKVDEKYYLNDIWKRARVDLIKS